MAEETLPKRGRPRKHSSIGMTREEVAASIVGRRATPEEIRILEDVVDEKGMRQIFLPKEGHEAEDRSKLNYYRAKGYTITEETLGYQMSYPDAKYQAELKIEHQKGLDILYPKTGKTREGDNTTSIIKAERPVTMAQLQAGLGEDSDDDLD
jgi:hypothetical protein